MSIKGPTNKQKVTNYPQPNVNNKPKHRKSPKIKLNKSKGFSKNG